MATDWGRELQSFRPADEQRPNDYACEAIDVGYGTVDGADVLAGIGNGPTAHENFPSGTRATFRGRAVAVIRATLAAEAGAGLVSTSGRRP